MGRQLTNKVNELKMTTFSHNRKQVKGIGGRGGLKRTGILNIQGHFVAAIRSSAGNVCAMKKAVMAIWEHRNKQHNNSGQWCPAKKQNGGDPDKNTLPPVFDTLSDDSLLQKCVHGGTQNTNESFHRLIWEWSPKTAFCGHGHIELAVADATVVKIKKAVVYNNGEIKRHFPASRNRSWTLCSKVF